MNCDLNVSVYVRDVTYAATMLADNVNKLETVHSNIEEVLKCSASSATSCHYKMHTVVTDTTCIKFTTFPSQIYSEILSRYIHCTLHGLLLMLTANRFHNLLQKLPPGKKKIGKSIT